MKLNDLSASDIERPLAERIREALTYVAGFPDQKYNFPDITPLLERYPGLFRDTITHILRHTESWPYDAVLCVESFGYIFGVPIAYERACNIVLMRRSGKLPRPTLKQEYSMCYDPVRCMEIHRGALLPGARVLVVDDFLVSGGTVDAALKLIEKAGAVASGIVCIVENVSWGGRAAINAPSVPILTLATIS